ncbi:MAG: hypothetical protein AAB305_06005 [Candidatus Zixiibacteriota bacterium]
MTEINSKPLNWDILHQSNEDFIGQISFLVYTIRMVVMAISIDSFVSPGLGCGGLCGC